MDGLYLKQLRISKGMTQAELAELLGYTDKAAISQIEHGKFELDPERIVKCARIFDVSVLDLVGREKEQPSETDKLVDTYKQLPSNLQERLLAYAEGLRDLSNMEDTEE